MKVRQTSYPNGFGGITPAGAVAPARSASEGAAARPAGASDAASIMGIPEAELTTKVRSALDQLMSEVFRLRQDLGRAQKRIDHLEALADQDTLTPVLNRRAFVRELSRIMAFSERYQSVSSVIYLDVNGLKQINDTLGHAAGDAALNHLATVLTRQVRASNVIGRLGGDEFGVILVQTTRELAQMTADRLAQAIKDEPAVWDGRQVPFSVSIGIHSFAKEGPVDQTLHAADQAMYAQKRPAAAPASDD
jgi:diguanylate cyclase (GGDEF)-like protein